jgi:mono/diheme cytochrome c family protein
LGKSGRWLGALGLAAGVALAAPGVARAGDGGQTGQAAAGAYLFRTYCATCHGTSARGDGPLADSMRRRPANLTEIAKRNKGTYPRDLVFRIIDGRQKVPGHGGPDMPVWGDAFAKSVEGGSEESVAKRIQALVDYLETIQATNAQQ